MSFGQFLTETDLEMTKVQIFQHTPSLGECGYNSQSGNLMSYVLWKKQERFALLSPLLPTITHQQSVTEHTCKPTGNYPGGQWSLWLCAAYQRRPRVGPAKWDRRQSLPERPQAGILGITGLSDAGLIFLHSVAQFS